MKCILTIEVEFSELPDEVRSELADGINFRTEEDVEISPDLETVPRVSEMTEDEIMDEVSEFFHALADYDLQAEMWAGSSVFGWVSEVSVKSINPA